MLRELTRAACRPAFKALAWNVAGLRAIFNNGTVEVLRKLVADEQPDLICLQEHKLQASHVAEGEALLRGLLGPAYGAFYWAVSHDKKGYSGVVVILKSGARSSTVGGGEAAPADSKQKSIASFLKKKPAAASDAAPADAEVTAAAADASATSPVCAVGSPVSVRFGLGERNEHAGEGRTVTLEFSAFCITVAYVPNSGEGLKRLDYRLGEWERDMRAHVAWLRASTGKPVVLGGDLNVAFRDCDIWNVTAKHIKKSAGCTPEERAAFAQLCADAALVDSFAAAHPEATGVFTYWSQRAGNRRVARTSWLCVKRIHSCPFS